MNMTWIDDIILGLRDTYNTTDPYDLCDLLKIFVKKVDSDYPILYKEPAIYIRNFYGKEAIFLRNDLNITYERFYLSHELGHAILHPYIKNSLNANVINIDKLEKQANYFAFKLIEIKFNEVDMHQMTVEQIASCLEVPGDALKQLVKI